MIRLASVTKRYSVGGRPALHGVTAQIDAGEFVFLVGPSGSGKSTLLRLLIREERASEGLVEVAGRDVARIADRRVPLLRRTVGCVFQDFRLLPDRTVAGNVAFALDVVGRPRHVVRSVVPEVLELVGLTGKEKRFPDELSGGEQQRVAIARAFVGRPLILLADEPTGNLDPATSAEIMDLLDDINQAGTTVLMATHNAGLVDAMRRRVLELDAGILVRDEHRGGYDATPATPATSATVPASAAPASAATGLPGVPGASGVPAQRAPSAGDLVGRPAEPAGLAGPAEPAGSVGRPGRPGERPA